MPLLSSSVRIVNLYEGILEKFGGLWYIIIVNEAFSANGIAHNQHANMLKLGDLGHTPQEILKN